MKKFALLTTLLLLAGLALVACSPTAATPETVIQTVEVPVVETVQVEVPVEVTKVVTEQVEVPVEVTAVPAADEMVYDRAETVYTSGTQWGPPSNWNPMVTWGYATGTIGLCYETLFLFDPLVGEYEPWLAESGEWTADNVYTLKIRDGITWADGEPFTADDVVFTFELGKKFPSVQYSPMWDWLESAVAVDPTTVEFTFTETLYQEWGNFLYSRPMLPKHLWEGKTEEEVVSGANENPVCTGPYQYETHSQDRMVWLKRDGWWANDLLGIDVKPKRVVDIVNGSNNVALGLVLQGGLDLSNNFLPGVATLIKGGYGVQTYYPDPPYMLSANTAWLVMNNAKPPMDDANFRRAMAMAVDTSQIVEVVYGNIVKAANPTGLLPNWDQFIDTAVVDKLGFSYDPEGAKALLAENGYVDTDGDGFVEAPDGSAIELKIMVPFGWSDWMESINVIAAGAQAAGINLVTDFPDYGGYADQLNSGTYDMAIANNVQIADTPWVYYDWIFQEPIVDTMTNGNFQRYNNQEAFDLVVALDKTPTDDPEAMKAVISQLQTIFLTDLPIVPLWYNGLWSQSSNAVWTNWPSSAEGSPHYLPATWRGYWNMGAIKMLTEIEPVPPAE